MTSEKDNGGAAFPQITKLDRTTGADYFVESSSGMSLRDYFAAKAMQSLIPIGYGNVDFNNIVVLASYRIADAMLEARNV